MTSSNSSALDTMNKVVPRKKAKIDEKGIAGARIADGQAQGKPGMTHLELAKNPGSAEEGAGVEVCGGGKKEAGKRQSGGPLLRSGAAQQARRQLNSQIQQSRDQLCFVKHQ